MPTRAVAFGSNLKGTAFSRAEPSMGPVSVRLKPHPFKPQDALPMSKVNGRTSFLYFI